MNLEQILNAIDSVPAEALSVIAEKVADEILERQQAALDSEATLREQLAQSLESLRSLRGPDEPTTPGLTSITEMLLFSDEDFSQHSGLAIRLILLGMKQLVDNSIANAQIQSGLLE